MELGDHTRSDEDEIEDREETELEIGDGITNHPEGEAVEESRTDVQSELVIDIVGVAPNGDVHTLSNKFALVQERHGEFESVICSTRLLGSSVGDDIVELLNDVFMLRGLEPYLVPVSALGQSSRNDIDHVLGWIGFLGAWSIVTRKVFFDRVGVITDVSKVHSFSSSGKKE